MQRSHIFSNSDDICFFASKSETSCKCVWRYQREDFLYVKLICLIFFKDWLQRFRFVIPRVSQMEWLKLICILLLLVMLDIVQSLESGCFNIKVGCNLGMSKMKRQCPEEAEASRLCKIFWSIYLFVTIHFEGMENNNYIKSKCYDEFEAYKQWWVEILNKYYFSNHHSVKLDIITRRRRRDQRHSGDDCKKEQRKMANFENLLINAHFWSRLKDWVRTQTAVTLYVIAGFGPGA